MSKTRSVEVVLCLGETVVLRAVVGAALEDRVLESVRHAQTEGIVSAGLEGAAKQATGEVLEDFSKVANLAVQLNNASEVLRSSKPSEARFTPVTLTENEVRFLKGILVEDADALSKELGALETKYMVATAAAIEALTPLLIVKLSGIVEGFEA